MSTDKSYKTIVIGGGQAGLAAGYFLTRRGESFTILDAEARTGDSWRRRWDSLRLFTPSKFNGLPGKPFLNADFYFPIKDEAAGYLEEYAGQFGLPIQHNVKVTSLSRNGQGYLVQTQSGDFHAGNVIVATGAYQKPRFPDFAQNLDPSILQLHSSAYCNPGQLPVQRVLVVGAANSGAEIGLELAKNGKQVWLAGRDVGRIPSDKIGPLLGGGPYWFLISRIFSVDTPVGRKMASQVIHHGAPLIRADRQEVARAGIESTPRVSGVESGKPQLEDGRTLPVDAIIWATGYRPDYSWIQLPAFDGQGNPLHARGVVKQAPGLYFLGLPFQTALSSALLGGVGRDAEYVTKQIRR